MNDLFEQQARDLAILAASEGYSLKPIVTVTLSKTVDPMAITPQALEE